MSEEVASIEFYNSLPDICSFCQREFTLQNPRTLDHIKPFCTLKPNNRNRKLGFKMISNLLICCSECNNLKERYTLEQFKNKLISMSTATKVSQRNRRWIHIPRERILVMIKSANILLANQ